MLIRATTYALYAFWDKRRTSGHEFDRIFEEAFNFTRRFRVQTKTLLGQEQQIPTCT